MSGNESSGDHADPASDARRLGEAEAELLHVRLRLRESLARELRLLERTIKAEEAVENALETESELRLQIERYASFHRAVEHSRAWRMIQAVRRLFGRAW
ncbi:MAG TPA: hypothetical protein VNC59_10145 [Thermoanaerobaculia bacterium]|nr:hypothetical protein [Thermoanaerobaculia bacterium]